VSPGLIVVKELTARDDFTFGLPKFQDKLLLRFVFVEGKWAAFFSERNLFLCER